jgi:hypothetical protein
MEEEARELTAQLEFPLSNKNSKFPIWLKYGAVKLS